MPQVKGPGTHFKQQRRHEEEVVLAHDDLDIRFRPTLENFFQVASGVDPAEAATKNQDPRDIRSMGPCTGCGTLVDQIGCLTHGDTPTVGNHSDAYLIGA